MIMIKIIHALNNFKVFSDCGKMLLVGGESLVSMAFFLFRQKETLEFLLFLQNSRVLFFSVKIKENAEIIDYFSVLVRVTGFEPAAS